mmetsp:Transcript_29663/g.58229  ORF Transcript_29663/g.58229 Transcript_29663/m.58229 type:complete len:94 (+) Transcript_29663:214-495(+)
MPWRVRKTRRKRRGPNRMGKKGKKKMGTQRKSPEKCCMEGCCWEGRPKRKTGQGSGDEGEKLGAEEDKGEAGVAYRETDRQTDKGSQAGRLTG